MQLISDFHIHGPYANACSRNTTLKLLEQNAKIKGLNILGTGDSLHPKWFQDITTELTEDENGILWTKNKFPFIWQTEISLMYTHNKKGRRIHHILLFPNKEVVVQVRDELLKRGRLDYDGRPIFGINSIEFVDMMRSISQEIEVIPAHCLTPWFSIFGSKSGFDSVEECFEEKSKYIHAIETGLSSDPSMVRRVSKFDKYNLVSFSDPHSYHPHRLGREATIFDTELTYKSILNTIRTGDGLKGTIEVNPNLGKYHLTGHRNCSICMNPGEASKLNYLCPKCKKPLTVGVAERIEELADRTVGKNINNYYTLLPLMDLLASLFNSSVTSKKVQAEYYKLIKNFGSELNLLLNVDKEKINKLTNEKITKAILINREGSINIKGGYDGLYGIPTIEENKKLNKQDQISLKEFTN